MEYEEESDDSQKKYLGWITATITAYNRGNGYPVQYEKTNNTDEWTGF